MVILDSVVLGRRRGRLTLLVDRLVLFVRLVFDDRERGRANASGYGSNHVRRVLLLAEEWLISS
jgi:hypothetical protein